MVTWADVTRWEPGPLQDAVGAINSEYNKLVPASEDLRKLTTPHGWTGPAAQAASAKVTAIVDRLEAWAAELEAGRAAAANVGDAIVGVKHGVQEARDVASHHNFTIADDGSVIDNGPPPGTTPELAEAQAAERKQIATELADRVKLTLQSADDVDNDFCSVLDRILNHQVFDSTTNDNSATNLSAAGAAGIQAGGLTIPAPPGDGATVAQNAAWWATLSGNQQRQLIHDHPGLVGNRDGVQGWARNEANLALVNHERTRLQSARADLQSQVDKLTHGPGHQNRRNVLKAEITKINDKLAGLDTVDKMMLQPRTKQPRGDRQLLSLDMSGDRPKAAVASGDIDTAEHVGVFTPGMNSDVQNSLPGYVNDMSDIRQEAGRILRDPTGEKVAMVTWLDYEPPTTRVDDLDGLVTGAPAEQGAEKLAKFQDGINASRSEDPHLTALGHSYGSTTTGIALTQNHGVDDAVFFGSPGISGSPDADFNASNINVPEGHAYNLAAEGDAISNVVPYGGRYGPHLGLMEGMDQLSTEAHGSLVASHGHSEYAVGGDKKLATSEHNMAAVVAGHPELAIRK